MFNRKSSYALNKKDPNAIVYIQSNRLYLRFIKSIKITGRTPTVDQLPIRVNVLQKNSLQIAAIF